MDIKPLAAEGMSDEARDKIAEIILAEMRHLLASPTCRKMRQISLLASHFALHFPFDKASSNSNPRHDSVQSTEP